MSECGAVAILQSTGVDIVLLSIATIFLLEQSRQMHYSTVIAKNNGNNKALWNTFKKLLHKSSTIILADYISPTYLANTFEYFFGVKIMKIRVAIQ